MFCTDTFQADVSKQPDICLIISISSVREIKFHNKIYNSQNTLELG